MADPPPRPFGGAPPEPAPARRPKSLSWGVLLVFPAAAWVALRYAKGPTPVEEPLRWSGPEPGALESGRMLISPDAPAPPASRAQALARLAGKGDRARRKARYQALLASLRGAFRAGEALPRVSEGAGPELGDNRVQVVEAPARATAERPADRLGVPAGEVRASYPPEVEAGLSAIRGSGRDGQRLYAYAMQERLPIEFAPLAPARKGEYKVNWLHSGDRFVGRDKASILLDESLREAGPKAVGLVLYHEYIHRLQDLSGQDIRQQSHTPEGMRQAIGFLRGQSQADPNVPLDVPAPVQASFGARP